MPNILMEFVNNKKVEKKDDKKFTTNVQVIDYKNKKIKN